MSKQFTMFIAKVNQLFLNFNADVAFDFIDNFWGDHEDDLIYDPNQDCEYSIVDDIFLLADQYNPSPEIVESTPYCIGPEEFRQGLIDRLKKYNLLQPR